MLTKFFQQKTKKIDTGNKNTHSEQFFNKKHIDFSSQFPVDHLYSRINHKNSESVIKAIEFILKFKIYKEEMLKEIAKQLQGNRKYVEKGFGLYLEIFKQMPAEIIATDIELLVYFFKKIKRMR